MKTCGVWMLTSLVLIAAMTAACQAENGQSSDGADVDVDGDSDADGDADGDSDTDADTDTESTSDSEVDTDTLCVEPPLEHISLGVIPVGEETIVDIPDGSLGFTVSLKTSDASDVVGFYRLKPADNGPVILDFAMEGTGVQAFGGQGSCAAAVPQSDLDNAWPVYGGAWGLTPGGEGATTSAVADVWVRRTADGTFHGGYVDINIFLSPGVASQEYLGAVLTQVFDVYYSPGFGLQLGEVNYLTLPSSYDVVDSEAEYRTMLMESVEVGPVPAVNLFVVSALPMSVQGMAGGVPGITTEHGTTRSGLAFVPTEMTETDALVVAHEMGHLGGLFHTTEATGGYIDFLSDTPFCADISGDISGCPDVSNLMFPFATGTDGEISPGQAIVMQGSALYRGIVAPECDAKKRGTPARWGAVSHEAATGYRPPQNRLDRILYGVWCGNGNGDPRDSAAAAARVEGPDRLLSIVLDRRVPDYARARAMDLLEDVADGEVETTAGFARRVLETGNPGPRLAAAAASKIPER